MSGTFIILEDAVRDCYVDYYNLQSGFFGTHAISALNESDKLINEMRQFSDRRDAIRDALNKYFQYDKGRIIDYVKRTVGERTSINDFLYYLMDYQPMATTRNTYIVDTNAQSNYTYFQNVPSLKDVTSDPNKGLVTDRVIYFEEE